jgi:chromosome segregation ATPase
MTEPAGPRRRAPRSTPAETQPPSLEDAIDRLSSRTGRPLGRRNTSPPLSENLHERRRLRADRESVAEDRHELVQERLELKKLRHQLEQEAGRLERAKTRLDKDRAGLAQERNRLRSQRLALIALEKQLKKAPLIESPEDLGEEGARPRRRRRT